MATTPNVEDQAFAFTPDLFIIPGQVMLDPELQPLDSKVYAAVYWLERLRDGRCYASNATIGKIVGSSSSGVANALTRLRDQGYIHCTYNETGGRTGIITLVHLNKNPYSNEEGGLTQTSNIGNKKKKESILSDLTDDQKAEMDKIYKLWLIHMVVDPEIRLHGDADSRSAALKAAATSYRFTDKRRIAVARRLNDAGYEMLVRAIKNLGQSSWHRGDNERGWKADIADFLCRSYEKVEEWSNKSNKPEELYD